MYGLSMIASTSWTINKISRIIEICKEYCFLTFDLVAYEKGMWEQESHYITIARSRHAAFSFSFKMVQYDKSIWHNSISMPTNDMCLESELPIRHPLHIFA